MLLTAALAAAGKYLAPYLPEGALQIAGFAASFAVISLLFAMMFKWLPDTEVAWRDVWLGAVLTAALFEVGKFLIGLYIGKQGLEIDLWRGGVDRGRAGLGVLFRAAGSVRSRIYQRLCPALRLETQCAVRGARLGRRQTSGKAGADGVSGAASRDDRRGIRFCRIAANRHDEIVEAKWRGVAHKLPPGKPRA